METTDLVVVGGGFAGLACAQAAALRGTKTVVLERKESIGSRLHTTGILVKEAADMIDVPRQHTLKIPGVRLYGPNLKSIDLYAPGYYFLATDTAAVLRWQATLAEQAGAEIRCGVSFSGATREPNGLSLSDLDLRARFLVGADGAKSRVAAAMGLPANRQFLVGVESEWEGVEGIDPSVLHVFLDAELAPGYIGWVVPSVGFYQIGLAAHERLSPRLEPFVQKMKKLFDFSKAKEVSKRGGLIPCGGTLRPFADNNVLLLGDAAGTVSPLTAGGIHSAVEIGRLAGITISDHLLDAGPLPQQIIASTIPSFAIKRLIRILFSRVQPPNWAYDMLIGSKSFRQFAQMIFFHHRGLLSAAAWKDLWHDAPAPEKTPSLLE
ncbi:MAG: NAD(P)/FAD-dependent oxidoreductase [Chthoniobacterales bacterium]